MISHKDFAKTLEENLKFKKGIKAVSDMMLETNGVCGLHLNGDIAFWHELRSGGKYEEWLLDFDEAEKIVLEDFKE